MKKSKLMAILASTTIFSSAFFSLSANAASISKINDPTLKITTNNDISASNGIPVTRIWKTNVIKFHIGGKASIPKTITHSERGFKGVLSLYGSAKSKGGYNGFYQGYLYNENSPIPIKSIQKNNTISNTVSSKSSAASITRYTTILYKDPSKVKNKIWKKFSDGYAGYMYAQEMDGNRDGYYHVIYKGKLYKNAVQP